MKRKTNNKGIIILLSVVLPFIIIGFFNLRNSNSCQEIKDTTSETALTCEVCKFRQKGEDDKACDIKVAVQWVKDEQACMLKNRKYCNHKKGCHK